MKTRMLTQAALAAAVTAGILRGGALVALAGELFVIDFESYTEGTPIGNQYAPLGVTFSAEGGQLPVIAVAGAPQIAFGADGVDDGPMVSGIAGLTDPVIAGDSVTGRDLRMTFDPPVQMVRFFAVDIDRDEVLTARAYRGRTELGAITRWHGHPLAGNGEATEFRFDNPHGITEVVIEVPDRIGFAIDALAFERDCPGPACGQRVRLSQESEPGLGDFDLNVRGVITSYDTNATADHLYLYDTAFSASFAGPMLRPVADRSHLVLTTGPDGLSVVVVHDAPDGAADLDGGAAEMRIEVVGQSLEDIVWSAEDEPEAGGRDRAAAESGAFGRLLIRHGWGPCCTDGYALTGFACGTSVVLEFNEADGNALTPVIEGLHEWMAYSSTGDVIPLALEPGRRVRLDVLGAPGCLADLTCDGLVDGDDIVVLMQRWGSSDDLADLDLDGGVDGWDLAALLARMGVCP
ncbi:MAG: hypothetical protein KDA25_11855 [Phycisphaerales bacterium]|nr:hypothetical protein [Phycisphaerales bacterium]